MRKARELIETGALGKIVAVHADFGFRCDDPPTSRMFNLDLAGGATLDIGVYPLAFTSMAFGGAKPSAVKAVGTKHETGADDSAAVAMTFGDSIALITYNIRGYTPVSELPTNRHEKTITVNGVPAVTFYLMSCRYQEEVIYVGTEARLHVHGPAHIATRLSIVKPNGRTSALDP